MSDLSVRPVCSDSEVQAFLRMPWEVYKDDPNWCPPLWAEHVHFFDREHNMELQHIDCEKFVAWRGDRPVGTIMAFINHSFNDYQKQNAGWFGQFEVLDDQAAAHVLLKTAEDWVIAKGADKLMGPATYSTNSEIGLLIEGYEYPHMIMTTHARPYVKGFVEGYGGFQKAMDLWCYLDDANKWGGLKADKPPERLARIVEKLKKHRKFTVRPVDMSRFPEEVERVKQIYNQAWSHNWGSVPISDREVDQMAAGLKDFIDPNIALFVEIDGKTAGFGLPLPDIYEPMRKAHCKPGEPNWWQLARLLWHWKIAGKITGVHVWALGVLEQYRGLGVDAVLYYEMLKRGLPRGYARIQMGWVLETNEVMNAIPKMIGSKLYKTFRVYEKMLAKS